MLNYLIQAREAEKSMNDFVERLTKEAEARGCTVRIEGDEIIIEEPWNANSYEASR